VTDNEAAIAAIRQVHDAWLAAELCGDVEAVLRLCTPDVRWLVPGRPVVEGREAARQLLQAAAVELLDIRAGDLRIEHSGELASKTSRYETRYRTGGQDGVARGTHLWVLRREGVAWRVALVTWQVEA
jgi:uncharacterized protein (TIGR02246 family)